VGEPSSERRLSICISARGDMHEQDMLAAPQTVQCGAIWRRTICATALRSSVSNAHGNIALRKVAPLLLATLFLISCNPEISAAGSDLAVRDLFATNCAVCHGPTGSGDGPAAASLQTQPSDLTKIADRRDGVWPMEKGDPNVSFGAYMMAASVMG
jgi:cytochrome c553